jgi:hypothetical protein
VKSAFVLFQQAGLWTALSPSLWALDFALWALFNPLPDPFIGLSGMFQFFYTKRDVFFLIYARLSVCPI